MSSCVIMATYQTQVSEGGRVVFPTEPRRRDPPTARYRRLSRCAV
jgi:hypothetical protein